MAVIGINYCKEKDNNIIYNYVYLHTSNNEFIFNSGNFLKDWYDANKKYFNDQYKFEFHFFYSTSVSDFNEDNKDFEMVYLVLEDEKQKLLYQTRNEHIKMFVPKGQVLTWEQLKNISQ